MSLVEPPSLEYYDVNLERVRELVCDQYPEWAHLPLKQFASEGTDNAVFRLGEEMVVRLPRTKKASLQVEKEQLWLPRLAPYLSLTIPTLLGAGRPTDTYPFPWSIYDWIKGDIATVERVEGNVHRAARTLGTFITSLQAISSSGGPLPGEHNFYRGAPLTGRDDMVQVALTEAGSAFDVQKARRVWSGVMQIPEWKGPPMWIHGDLADSNILWRDGDIRAVIDFGGLCVGDPACDLMIGWDVVAGARSTFRETVAPDDDSWERGRGWALSTGLITFSRFKHSRPGVAACALHKITQVLSDEA